MAHLIVQLGRWASLVFTTWQELCFAAGVHPFTGASTEAEPPGDSKTTPAGPKARAGASSGGAGSAPAARARAQLQRCFLQACSGAQEQLARETASLVRDGSVLRPAAARCGVLWRAAVCCGCCCCAGGCAAAAMRTHARRLQPQHAATRRP